MTSLAMQSLDALEQRFREAGVEAPVHTPEAPQWVGTCLGIAGTPLLIGEGELEEIIETPDVMAIPGTKPWVMGVGSHMGGLIPIISGDVFFRGKPYAGRVRDYCMVLRRPGFYFGITLSAIERDMRFPVEQRDTEQAVEADFAPYAAGGFADGERFLPVLDIEKLIADGDMSNAAATDADSTEDHNNGTE
jgi:twitching motility protein PilI